MSGTALLLLLSVLPAFAAAGLLPAAILELRDGQRWSKPFVYRDGHLQIEDGQTIPASAVKQLLWLPPDARDAAGDPAAAPPTADATGTTVGAADDTARELLAVASAAADFIARHPGAAGVILDDTTRWTWRADGTWTTHVRFVGLVLKPDRLGWADQAAVFVEGRSRVKVIRARSIRPDGAVAAFDPAQAKPGDVQTHPGMFIKYQLVSFRVPGVEVGSLIDVEYETEEYNPYHREFFFPVNFFQGGDPVLVSRIEVAVPRGRPLFWEGRNLPAANAEPRRTETAESDLYTWEMHEIAPLVPEPMMPNGGDSRPYLQCSLFEGWEPVYDWINNYWVANTRPTPAVASLTRAVVGDAADEDEKIARIFHWIEKNIRYIIIKGDAATIYGSYPAAQTIDSRFGCCVDKAVVFSAMLAAIGIESSPVLINAGSHDLSRRIPNLSITHAITRITRADGRLQYLDATGYDLRYPSLSSVDQGRLVMDPGRREIAEVPLQPPAANLHHLVSTMTLALDGNLAATTTKLYTGDNEAAARAAMKNVKPAERAQVLSRRVNGYGRGAELASFTFRHLDQVEEPYSYTFSYRVPDYPQIVADLVILRPPGFLDTFVFPEAALATRTHPIEFDALDSQREEGRMELAAGLSVRSVPAPVSIETPWYRFVAGYQQTADRGFTWHASFERLAKRVPIADYPRYREGLDRIAEFARQRVFLRRDQPEVKP